MLKRILNAFFVFCTLSVLSLFLFASSVKAEEQVSAESGQQEQPIVADSVEVGVASDEGTVITSGTEESVNQNETQDTDYSCGPAALVTWIKIVGGDATEAELIALAKTNAEEGTSFLNLKNAALAKGYTKAIVYKFVEGDLSRITFPALIYLNVEGSEIGHYAVLTKIENGIYHISDPQSGEITKTEEEFFAEFGGYAMVNGNINFSVEPPVVEKEPGVSINAESDTTVQESLPAVVTSDHVATTVPETPKSVTLNTVVASDADLANIRGKGVPFAAAIAVFLANPGTQRIIQASAQFIASGKYRGAVNVERVYRNTKTGQYMYRHTIYKWGQVLHDHFRPYGK